MADALFPHPGHISVDPEPEVTVVAYREQFVIEEELDDAGEMVFGWRCNICDRDVETGPCPEHRPEIPAGLRAAECWAEPKHDVVWAVDRDDYGFPCLYCQYDSLYARHEGCEHARHGRWRRWRIAHRAARWAYALGIIAGGGGSHYGGGCHGCLTSVIWRGCRPYILGRARHQVGEY